MSFPENIVWSPCDYAKTAVLAEKIGTEMLARLEWMAIKPKLILDAGCGIGNTTHVLQKRFPEANVLAVDRSLAMITEAKQQVPGCVCADSNLLPLKNQSVDLIYANLLLPWISDIKKTMMEWRRVLKTNGLLLFTALGPDTMSEWRNFFSVEQMPLLIDMHDIGDMLVQAGFDSPVLESDYYTLTYREKSQLFYELYGSGMVPTAVVPDINPATNLEVTYEVVYAHTWTPPSDTESFSSSDGTVRVPLSQLRNSLKAQE